MAPLVLAAVLWQASAPLTVPHGERRSLSLPATGVPARLAFRVRADYPRFAGSNLFLRLLVNDVEVGPMRDRRTARLVGPPAAVAPALPRFELGRWRVRYGPGGRPDDELVLDVSDLLRADGPNVVTFEHGPPSSAGPTPLVVEQVRLERAPGAAVAPRGPHRAGAFAPRLRLPPPPSFTVRADHDSIDVAWAREQAVVRTAVRGGVHRRERQIVVMPTHVEVRDTIHNPTTAVIGLRIRHAVATAADDVRLSGRLAPEVRDAYAPWNPTVFTPVGAGGLGLVAEDDVFRQQVRVDDDPADGTLGLRTDMLCLAPGDSATIVWSIYPLATGSYWDFLNTLRQDWGVNHTVPGGYVWFTPDMVLARPVSELGAALARERVAIASMWGGWIDPARPGRIGFGTAVLGDDFAELRKRIAEAVGRLHAARPGITVLLYFDAQRDSVPDAPERYADSLLVPPGGGLERTDWGGRFTPAWGVVPTRASAFGRAMEAVPAAMRRLGADGLYWDEMDGVDYSAPRATARIWDGRSCVLDGEGRVLAQLGLANLLSDDMKRDWAASGRVLGNTPPTTRRFQARQDVRMVELQHGPAWSAFAHLTTPLGYLGARRDWAAVVETVEAGLLPAGTSLDYAYDVPRLFPLTPEYLQPGTLRGRERIVTTRSGTHGWLTGGGDVRAFHYDAAGREYAARWRVKRRREGLLVRVRLGAGELGVIERTDAHAQPPVP